MSVDRRKEILENLIRMESKGQLEKTYYDGIPIEVYHHPLCPGVSSTKLKAVDKPPEKNDSEKPAFVFGRAFHTLILEPTLFTNDFVVGTMERETRRTYISFADYDMMIRMKNALSRHSVAYEMIERSIKERTFFSRDKETGLLKKCRTDSFNSPPSIADLKSCASAEKSKFAYDAKKFRYGFSAAYYISIVSEVLDSYVENFYWIAVEKSMSPKVAIYHPNQSAISKLDMEVRTALETYKLNLSMKDKPFIGSSEESEEIWV